MSADDVIRNQYPITDDPYATRRLPAQHIVGQTAEVAPPLDTTESPRRTRTRPPHSGGKKLLNALVVLVVLVLVGVSSGLYYLDRSYQGKIYPNVSIAGVHVGEMSPSEAAAALHTKHEVFLNQPITLTLGERSWQPSAKDLGISFNFDEAVEAAYRSGRGQGLLADVQNVAAIWQNGLELPLSMSIDQRAIQSYVSNIAAELDQAPTDATLTLNGISVDTTPAQVGRQVQINETVQDITNALGGLSHQSVGIRERELLPRLGDAEVADARARIEAMIASPLTLTVNEKTYTWSPNEIALMLDIARVSKDAGSDRIDVVMNRLQVDRRLRTITDETGRGSVNPRLAWNGGNLKIIKPGETGLRLDEDAARTAILGWAGEQRELALPVKVVEPDVTEANLNSLGIKELVSVGRSDFSGSAPYRITNIGVGMEKFNGLLLAPGEEFSFNENVGSIDARNGFVEGYAIIQNRTQLEFGGGICQDSTTIFRAAFWAGLPITERWGHSFYINWYDKYALGPQGDGPGMDATIFTGGPDLKFVNDTGNWLLIQSFSNPASGLAQVELYGTKLDRKVELKQEVVDRKPAIQKPQFIADPEQPRGTWKRTDTKRGGMTIHVYRTVTENGQRGKPELFKTVFQPWADKYAIHPADMGANGLPVIGPWAPAPAPAPVDPNTQPVDPNAPVQPPVDPSHPQPVDPNVQPQPTADPNVQPQPETPIDPNAQPQA